jgi:hypothetical protein
MTAHITTLDRTERTALGIVATASVGFGAYGLAQGASSTLGYLFVVTAAVVALVCLQPPLPRPVTLGLSALAVAHLAGGLVEVGDDVLYNASVWSPVFQYDHLVHASGVFLGVLVLQALLAPAAATPDRRPPIVLLCVLGGLGLGALNELIEFLATLAHDGTHVGGYENTGWDLSSNLLGALGAGLVLRSRSRHPA